MKRNGTKCMAMFVSLALGAGCGLSYRYEYMSFEATPGAVVQSTAQAKFEGLFFGWRTTRTADGARRTSQLP